MSYVCVAFLCQSESTVVTRLRPRVLGQATDMIAVGVFGVRCLWRCPRSETDSRRHGPTRTSFSCHMPHCFVGTCHAAGCPTSPVSKRQSTEQVQRTRRGARCVQQSKNILLTHTHTLPSTHISVREPTSCKRCKVAMNAMVTHKLCSERYDLHQKIIIMTDKN